MHCTFVLTSVWLLSHITLKTLKISPKSLCDVHLSTAAKSMKIATVQTGNKRLNCPYVIKLISKYKKVTGRIRTHAVKHIGIDNVTTFTTALS